MMIYTRHGLPVRIAGVCGEHKPFSAGIPITLLKLEELNDENEPIGKFRYYFKAFLKAEGGINEIEQAIKNVPEIELKDKELKKAIQQAM